MKWTYFFMYLIFSLNVSAQLAISNDSKEIVSRNLLLDPKVDANLKRDINIYQSALLSGDFDRVYSYIYTGAIQHIKNKFPEYKIDKKYVIQNILKPTHDQMERANREINADFKYVPGDIYGKEKIGNTLIFVIHNIMEANVKNERIKIPSKTYCFSSNSGSNWKFMEYDSESSPQILKDIFGQQHVNELIKLARGF